MTLLLSELLTGCQLSSRNPEAIALMVSFCFSISFFISSRPIVGDSLVWFIAFTNSCFSLLFSTGSIRVKYCHVQLEFVYVLPVLIYLSL